METHLCSDRAVSLACPDIQQDEIGRVAPVLSEAPSLLLETPLISRSPQSPLKHRGRLVLSHHVPPGARSVLACPEGTTESTYYAYQDSSAVYQKVSGDMESTDTSTNLLKLSDPCNANHKPHETQGVRFHPSSTAASPRHKATLPHCPGWCPHS